MPSEKVCRRCGNSNPPDAERCASCSAKFGTAATPEGATSVNEDPALRYVDPNNRMEVTRFERLDQAEVACGMLRANGIACELSSPVLPGLPGEIILWVHNNDAPLAGALLADAEREAERSEAENEDLNGAA